ncbi:LOG family protein [Nocardioides korecus]
MTRRPVEIETLEEFDRRAAEALDGDGRMAGWQLQSLDLRERGDVLRRLDPRGAVLLGCTLPEDDGQEPVAGRLRAGGALLFPAIPDVPFDPWRGHLYAAEELYAGLTGEDGYAGTPDARIYGWSQRLRHGVVKDTLAAAVHDSSIDDALAELVADRRLVGVMGGHALQRDEAAYAEAAHLARDLARAGLTVVTGGGPGAMEAANLGARLAGHDDAVLADALTRLAAVPSFHPDTTSWARVALEVVAELDDAPAWRAPGTDRDPARGSAGGSAGGSVGGSIGVPTWYYGHEPPNVFAEQVAKYFRNAIREDVLLEVCRAGIVFLTGAAGTVQEVFQAACSNYYADAEDVAPMVLVGREQWTATVPAWPLLEALAQGRPLAGRAHLVDDVADVVGLLA